MGKHQQQQQKNIISQQNIQLIEQIGEGEFGTGESARPPAVAPSRVRLL